MSSKPQVFGIGLSRTGTSSLNRALRMLGLTSKHFPVELVKSKYNAEALEKKSATDTPVAWRFKVLANRYPEAKFVLTWRDETTWLDSCRRLWIDQKTEWDKAENDCINQMHQDLYDTIDFDSKKLMVSRSRHHVEVFNHFRKENRLLEMNIAEGDGWAKLCRFLGCESPSELFPRVGHEAEHADSPLGSWTPTDVSLSSAMRNLV
jgi:hypothetical protein